MIEQQKFGYTVYIAAQRDYPVEIYKGWLANTDKFITAIFPVGVQGSQWGKDGKTNGGGGLIPSQLSLTWVSYAEKKFWTIQTKLPADTILALFKQGFILTQAGVTAKATYNGITFGLAPGGVVVVWMVGTWHRTEVGRFQAKDTVVDVNDFSDNSQNFTQNQFMQYSYDGLLSQEARDRIKTKGIPYGLWDTYRIKYNYKFRTQFYKEDKEKGERDCTYFNGEEEILNDDEISIYRKKPLPWRAEFYFNAKWAETEFNDQEIMAAFKELTKTNKEEQIEIIGKVGFMYNDMSFIVKSKDKEIPLKKVKISMWNRAAKPDTTRIQN